VAGVTVMAFTAVRNTVACVRFGSMLVMSVGRVIHSHLY
jgi:hypothetical protein